MQLATRKRQTGRPHGSREQLRSGRSTRHPRRFGCRRHVEPCRLADAAWQRSARHVRGDQRPPWLSHLDRAPVACDMQL